MVHILDMHYDGCRYISTLYSHQNWPEMAPGEMQEELKNNIRSTPLWRLNGAFRYIDCIRRKKCSGQPVSFTDFFGHMVGETLLKGVSGPLTLYLLSG